jgi:macrodomain Ter protein organizer (MatP/YcbG family)
MFTEKNMNTIALTTKKRKNIDLSEDTFRALSVLASANGKNLKAYIENILDDEAKMLKEENIYREFLKDKESQEIISIDEKASFEKWLGI